MQAPTHIIMGTILQRFFKWREYKVFSFILLAFTGILSHAVLDKLAKVTYHPADADFQNPFWLGFHVLVFLITIFSIYYFGKENFIGIFFAILPDLDWVFIHGAKLFGQAIPFYQKPYIHNFLNSIMESTVPFSFLENLPNWRMNPLAASIEIVLYISLFFLAIQMTKHEKWRQSRGYYFKK